ncbi:hypothetical protein AB0H76_22255 [Nocardia sp. NPDC050712]|uniref:hypothetical protein n=1 Tax=Nocardia sp. NPDC050712 TaxID=3155518 RepID=UPI0033D530FF
MIDQHTYEIGTAARDYQRTRLGAAGLAVAAVLSVVYETAAPRLDQSTLAGAESWAGTGWLVGHIAAVGMFVLYTVGLLGLYLALRPTRSERTALRATVLAWIGVGLTLPYYGAEVFGLRAIGAHAAAVQDQSLVPLGENFRSDPTASTMFALGLGLLGVAAVLAAVAVWRSQLLPRTGAIRQAVGFALFIPQFFAPQPVRIGHAVLLAIGLLALAWGMVRARTAAPQSVSA